MGKVDVDDFCNYAVDMEDGISASFQITRFGFGRGNYQRMEIYGSEGAIVYSLDARAPALDEIEVCSGDINADAHVFNKLPIPERYYRPDAVLCRYPQRRGRRFNPPPFRMARRTSMWWTPSWSLRKKASGWTFCRGTVTFDSIKI